MKFSIRDLSKEALAIIRHDSLILAPYLIFFILLNIGENFKLGKFIGDSFVFIAIITVIGWLICALIEGFVVYLGVQIYKKNPIMPTDIFKTFLSRIPALIFATGIITLPVYGIFEGWKTVFLTDFTNGNTSPLMVGTILLALVPIIGLSLVLNFIPPIIMATHSSGISAIRKAFDIVRHYFKEVLLLTSMMIFTIILFELASLLVFRHIPYIGEPVLGTLGSAVAVTLTKLLTLVFVCRYFNASVDTVA